MHVLIVGAGGFIGRHVAGRLLAAGARVTLAARAPERLRRSFPMARTLACDLARDRAADWAPRLAGIDAVVNCAGIIGNRADYAGVHDRGARALFDACLAAGVGRVIQISSLGADESGVTAYHRSKKRADDHLMALDPAGERMGWAVLRLSLVMGRGGASTALFTALAALPLLPRLGSGRWQVQPIHIDDLARAVLRLLERPGPLACALDAVGPQAVSTDELTEALRGWLGLAQGRAPKLSLPKPLLALVARLGIGPATRESLTMLAAGNTAPSAPFVAALGFCPMTLGEALARYPACAADLTEARLRALAPVLAGLLALVWLGGGIVSLALAPTATVAPWLGRVGLAGPGATAALWAGSLADIAVGLGLILRRRGAPLAGVALMAVYTAILTAAAPELWADPFGPLVKNLAVLGLSLALFAMEGRRG
ncbi:SDR family oxidoreductase [Novosphingobium sp. KA1]|uniref:SDR family oxidoreductase n=1 Tax=Novosphingobium sp. (strain KA1) TaxID=164608 RepID=UPI001A8D2E78|nr:SDR family oxidoreductase [Novosphingobium sp. KA1]QSR19029.1 NAD-dependent dehydratase [Novosphingobium sp. KA1]